MLFSGLLLSVLFTKSFAEVFFKPQNAFESLDGPGPSFPIDLSSFANNRAFGMSVGDADFDETESLFSHTCFLVHTLCLQSTSF